MWTKGVLLVLTHSHMIASYCMGGWEYVFFSVGKKWISWAVSKFWISILRLFIDMFMSDYKKDLDLHIVMKFGVIASPGWVSRPILQTLHILELKSTMHRWFSQSYLWEPLVQIVLILECRPNPRPKCIWTHWNQAKRCMTQWHGFKVQGRDCHGTARQILRNQFRESSSTLCRVAAQDAFMYKRKCFSFPKRYQEYVHKHNFEVMFSTFC